MYRFVDLETGIPGLVVEKQKKTAFGDYGAKKIWR